MPDPLVLLQARRTSWVACIHPHLLHCIFDYEAWKDDLPMNKLTETLLSKTPHFIDCDTEEMSKLLNTLFAIGCDPTLFKKTLYALPMECRSLNFTHTRCRGTFQDRKVSFHDPGDVEIDFLIDIPPLTIKSKIQTVLLQCWSRQSFDSNCQVYPTSEAFNTCWNRVDYDSAGMARRIEALTPTNTVDTPVGSFLFLWRHVRRWRLAFWYAQRGGRCRRWWLQEYHGKGEQCVHWMPVESQSGLQPCSKQQANHSLCWTGGSFRSGLWWASCTTLSFCAICANFQLKIVSKTFCYGPSLCKFWNQSCSQCLKLSCNPTEKPLRKVLSLAQKNLVYILHLHWANGPSLGARLVHVGLRGTLEDRSVDITTLLVSLLKLGTLESLTFRRSASTVDFHCCWSAANKTTTS